MRVGIVAPRQCLLTHQSILLLGKDQSTINCLSVRLLEVAYVCQGFSGRVLRKLPFLGTSPTTVVILVVEDSPHPPRTLATKPTRCS